MPSQPSGEGSALSSGSGEGAASTSGRPAQFTSSTPSQQAARGTAAGDGTSHQPGGETGNGDPSETSDDVGDWRAAVIKGDFNADLTAALLKQAFASELEKHVAIQCVALVAGNPDRLSNWHWRVWRDAKEFGYPLSGKERFPAQAMPAALQSTLHKFVVASAPLLVRRFRPRFTLEHVARRLEATPAAIEKARKPLSWNEGILRDTGFHLFADRIAQRRYFAFNVPGLGREIFYDGVNRAIYLDEGYYRKVPPSHLFHRVLGVLWSVRAHYFVPLALHPLKEFMPFLQELNQFFGSVGLSMIKSRLTGKATVGKYLAGMDTRVIKGLHAKIGTPSDEQIVQLWEAMRAHIFRLLLAETLDVIGVFESLLDRDLLKKQTLKHSEIYQLSSLSKPLMEFITKLRV